jgi:hypothetical protein
VWHTPMVVWTVAVTFPGLAPVAQLDRAGGFYPSGCGFDSCRGRQDVGRLPGRGGPLSSKPCHLVPPAWERCPGEGSAARRLWTFWLTDKRSGPGACGPGQLQPTVLHRAESNSGIPARHCLAPLYFTSVTEKSEAGLLPLLCRYNWCAPP